MASRGSEKQRLRAEREALEQEARRAQKRRQRGIGAAAAALVAAVAVVVALAAGGGDDGAAPPGDEGGPAPISDVHGVGVNPADDALYIASHDGLYRSEPGAASAARVDGPEQDLMGFSVAGADRFFASGHPGPGQGGPTSLGLIESRDRGASWKPISLSGTDLHLLRAAGDAVYAFDGKLRVSADGGRTWEQRTAPDELIDLAIDPADGVRVLASTGSGVQLSTDAGRTWNPTALKAPVLVGWGRASRPAAVTADGAIHTSTDGGRTWKQAGSAGGRPAAFAADGDGNLYVARADGAVDFSTDGGRTWGPRSRN